MNRLKKTTIMIKKILFGFAILASVASCTDDYTDWAQPQANPQQDAVTFGDGSVAPVGVIDFANIPETQEMVQVCTITAPSASAGTYNPEYILTIDGTEYAINTNGEVNAADLQDYITSTFGRRPVEREVEGTVSMWLNDGTSAVKLTSGTFKIKTIPNAPQISEAYYLIGGIEGTSWAVTDTRLQFKHSDKDVYEDPIFTITVPVNTGDTWFAISDKIAMDNFNSTGGEDQLLGCAEGNGNNGMEGIIARRSEIGDNGAFKVTVAADEDVEMIRITLNMMDYSYKIQKLPPLRYYYVVGTPSWDADKAYKSMFYTLDSKNYTFTTKWNGAWDLKIWDIDNLENWDNAWGTSIDGDGSASGSLINTGAQSFQSPEAGFYTLSINKKDMTYTWTRLDNQSPTEYTSVSLIGDFNSWGGDVDMEQVAAHNWFVEYTVPSNGGLKFRADHGWAVSWGTSDKETAIGDSYYLPIGGDNINVPAGTYQFYLNDITGEWNIVKK